MIENIEKLIINFNEKILQYKNKIMDDKNLEMIFLIVHYFFGVCNSSTLFFSDELKIEREKVLIYFILFFKKKKFILFLDSSISKKKLQTLHNTFLYLAQQIEIKSYALICNSLYHKVS